MFSVSRILSFLLVSDEIYNYAQSREKSKVKFILCAETMKVLIWLGLE
jgi:hypothetical protein